MDNSLSFRNTLLFITLVFSLVGWPGVVSAADPASGVNAAEVSTTIDINTASATDIAEVLHGIGVAKAEAIVAYRDEHGPFKSLEDLGKVKGVGEKTLERNASRIRF